MKIEEIMSASKREKVMRKVEKRRQTIRDAVRSVCCGYTSAAFFHGPGGLGKTHIITEELDCLSGKEWKHHTAGTTPKGLIMLLAERPDSIHLFEDCEKMYNNADCTTILRAACGAPGDRDRWLSYKTAFEHLQFNFRGGVIIVSNQNLGRSKGPMAAVASRFRPIKWDLTIEERIAVILSIADQGWEKGERHLDPSDCRIVAKFLIEEMTGGTVEAAIDLRTYTEHALPAYALYLYDDPLFDWKSLLRAKLAGQVTGVESRDKKNDRLEMLAMSINSNAKLKTPQKVKLWNEKTGLAQAQYFRHLKAAKSKGLVAFDSEGGIKE